MYKIADRNVAWKILSGLVLAVFAALVSFATLANAADDKQSDDSFSYGGGNVSSYSAKSHFDIGTIVELDKDNSSQVNIATKQNLANMFGVVVDRNELPMTISGGNVKNETYVATSGTYRVLVSDEAGSVAPGDYITMSSVNGVAMKASTEEKTVFGRANATFDGKGVVLGRTTVRDTTGTIERQVSFGSIPVTINIQRNPNIQSTMVDVPPFLQRVGQAIAEKEVSPLRVYTSVGIAAASLITAIVVVYAGVRNSFVAIGRNPMSKKSIARALTSVILTGFLILVIGLFAVYLLLKL